MVKNSENAGDRHVLTAMPMRSVVYRFGNDAAMCTAASEISADALLLDLEDSVAPSEKHAARANVAHALGQGRFRARTIIVRINAIDSCWCDDDLRALAGHRIDAIMLPKAETGEALRMLARLADALGIDRGVAFWAMIETPAGVLRAVDIATATPRLQGIAVGTGDLSRGLSGYPRFTPERLPLLPALGQCLLAARMAGRMIIDGAYRDPTDTDGFTAACRASRELGFDGRTMVDPALAVIADREYGPSESELHWARRIVAAVAAVGPGEPARVDGRLVEPGYLTQAQRFLDLAAAIDAVG